jgi:ribosomal protein S18 acetylase RimI-like enzyme
MNIQRLTPADASAFQALRLAALREAPSAFTSSYEDEKDLPLSAIEARLVSRPDRGIYGAFDNETLVGLVALGRESSRKQSHKAWIWGAYVEPRARGQGIGRALLAEALSMARAVPEIRQVNLSVTADNAAALHLYQSMGFVVYGREADALFVDGKPYDEIHMHLRFADTLTPLVDPLCRADVCKT